MGRHILRAEGKTLTTFRDLGVLPEIADALERGGITTPFPIQEMTLSVALLGMSALGLAATGSIALNTVYLFLIGLPAVVVGTLAGFRLYGKIDDEKFRKIVLWLLLVAGAFLLESLW